MNVIEQLNVCQKQQMEQDKIRGKMMHILHEHDIEVEDIPENDYQSFKEAGVSKVKNQCSALKKLDYMDAGRYICLKPETDDNGTVVVYIASMAEVLSLDEEELYFDLEMLLGSPHEPEKNRTLTAILSD